MKCSAVAIFTRKPGMDAAVAIRRPSSKTSSKNKGGWFERPVLLRVADTEFRESKTIAFEPVPTE